MQCRICSSEVVERVGEVEFYFGYKAAIYDCDDCGCRFTHHRKEAYDRLYSEPNSSYARYRLQHETTKALFDRGDRAGLRNELLAASKYKFVIEGLDHLSAEARLLEVGASLGHLTSHFILSGRNILGMDVSPAAVNEARKAFGPHFVVSGDDEIASRAPYDAIFHVGTIGCVEDPIGFSRQLIRMLRPGGLLMFNAPNREAAYLRGQLWFDSAPPPDLVTLFPRGFWRRQFDDVANIEETVELLPAGVNRMRWLESAAGRRWRPPWPMELSESARPNPVRNPASGMLWSFVRRFLDLVDRMSRDGTANGRYPSEYGLFVCLTKKHEKLNA